MESLFVILWFISLRVVPARLFCVVAHIRIAILFKVLLSDNTTFCFSIHLLEWLPSFGYCECCYERWSANPSRFYDCTSTLSAPQTSSELPTIQVTFLLCLPNVWFFSHSYCPGVKTTSKALACGLCLSFYSLGNLSSEIYTVSPLHMNL